MKSSAALMEMHLDGIDWAWGANSYPHPQTAAAITKTGKKKQNAEQTHKWAERPMQVLPTVNSTNKQKSKAVTVASPGALWPSPHCLFAPLCPFTAHVLFKCWWSRVWQFQWATADMQRFLF